MDRRDIVYLGGLLHDIGKFMYRSQQTKAGEGHEPLGENFTREYLTTKFECLRDYDKDIINAVNRGNTFIREADHAAASERIQQDNKLTRRPLYSIYKYIDIGLGSTKKEVYYYKPEPLVKELSKPEFINIDEDVWKPNDNEMINLHKVSLEKFYAEIKEIYQSGNTSHLKATLGTLFSLLWKYTSTVSSASYLSNPDISLFDHSRMVAALSICMKDSDDIQQPIILLKGDISGIQKFIYSEIKETDKASKKLRGRSFFIKILSDTLSSYITREFNLYEANIIYNSGGGFEILLPSNDEVKQKLIQIERHINKSLYDLFGVSLQVVLAWGEYATNTLFGEFNKVQDDLTEKLGKKKSQKSLSIFENIFPEIIEDKSEDISGINFEEIGTAIPHTSHLIEVQSDEIDKLENKENIINLSTFGEYWYLVNKSEHLEESFFKIKKTNPKYTTLYNIEDSSLGKLAAVTKKYPEIPIALSFKFIATNAPLSKYKENCKQQESNKGDEYRLLEFSELAEMNSCGYPLLGVLRMDVDNLGFIFKQGLKNKAYSISRLASLSRQMDMFFTRDVDILAKEHKIYITYSGGDDLFAVGSWVNIIKFAQKVRKKFAEYTTNNSNVTLSAGIAITKSNYPIAKSAKLSGENEDAAKSGHISNDDKEKGRKDRISLFEVVSNWKELESKIDFAEHLNEIIESNKENSKGISNSFVYKLLANVKQMFNSKGDLQMDRVYNLTAKLHYLFARREMTENDITEDKNPQSREIKSKLLQYFLKSEQNERARWYKTFPVIGNYVILKNRKLK